MSARWVAVTILGSALTVAAIGMVTASPTMPPAAPASAPAAGAAFAPPPAAAKPAPNPVPVAAPKPAPATAPLVIRHVIDTGGGPLRYGSYFWDDAATKDGPLTITVDVKASVLSVFRGGDEIGTAAVITGNDGKETPIGTFPILSKDRRHVSKKYRAPMPYTLRLTGDGVSIHASPVAVDYATHGCIGLPAGFAAKLFAVAKVGDRVIITKRGMIADVTKTMGRSA